MKSKTGKTLYGARVREGMVNTIIMRDANGNESPVGVILRQEAKLGVFTEMDIVSLSVDGTLAYTWAPEKPADIPVQE